MCCILEQDALLLQCLYPPWCTCIVELYARGDGPIQGGVEMRLTSFGIHVRLRKIMFSSGAKLTNFITNLLHAVSL